MGSNTVCYIINSEELYFDCNVNHGSLKWISSIIRSYLLYFQTR